MIFYNLNCLFIKRLNYFDTFIDLDTQSRGSAVVLDIMIFVRSTT